MWWILNNIMCLMGILDEMVVFVLVFVDVVEDINVFMEDVVFVVYNVNFDYGFIK